MTEEEWNKCRLKHELLDTSKALHSWRKLLLLGCACCRWATIHGRDPNGTLSNAVDFFEEGADKGALPKGRYKKWDAVQKLERPGGARAQLIRAFYHLLQLGECKSTDAGATYVFLLMNQSPSPKNFKTDTRTQRQYIRDIFGNPFRPVAFDPRWRTSDSVGVARGIYEDRAFERLPILADALMDAGCADEQVLSHCRGEGPHVRGCWVVDLVLGKE